MHYRPLLIAALLMLTSGCASGLNSIQQAELDHYRANNLAAEEKSPTAAMLLGLLPGGGSFYGRAYVPGTVNLLLWPVSVLWDPFSGYNAAESINYQVTRAHVARLKRNEMEELDSQLLLNAIDQKHYAVKRRMVNEKFSNGY
ncbi:hypothetical protein [Pseudomonas sp. CCOS 191]|uniref:hypothetical protein n=1 Tax=Pseudomonas sp. CCOS 191 TaxID=1649877 RepID=UPI0018E6A5D5|nr:hypothetical protein [Pseudomonas sp. CCOS 191]MBI6954863.1 hypothetical protein [Pseudomonas sp. CCOS 191]